MDNIIQANKKRENLLSKISCLGCVLFILTGVIGCNIIEDGGSTFGWILFGVGVVLYFYMEIQQYNLKESGGPLTKRRLSNEDLMGLGKEDLERLRLHIYAKHGYNFNVNDGLYYINKIAKHHFPNYISIGYLSDLNELRRKTGCDAFFILASDLYRLYSSKCIEEMSEKEKDEVRKRIEKSNLSVFEDDMSRLYHFESKIGYYDRNGKYGHEGKHYYKFQDCVWYKPTTCKIGEVYSKMSEIEKYNIEFIKAYEVMVQ